MSKENQHIKKYLDGKLPEPEIQADDAWAQLNDMLGQTSAPDSSLQTAGKLKYLAKYGLAILSGVSIVAGSWFLLSEGKTSKITANTVWNEVFHDSLGIDNKVEINAFERPEVSKDSSAVGLFSGEKQQLADSSNRVEEKYGETNNLSNPSAAKSVNNNSVKSSSDKKASIDNEINTENNRNATPNPIIGHGSIDRKNHKEKSNAFNGFKPNSVFKTPVKNEKKGDLLGENYSKRGIIPSEKMTGSDHSTEKTNETNSAGRINFSVKNLSQKSVHFPGPKSKSNVKIIYQKNTKKIVEDSKKPFLSSFHAGLEWNATSSFKNTRHLLPGADSIGKYYLLLIPGVWVSKDLTEKQSVTATFFPIQQYFAGDKLIRETGDSTVSATRNTHMIKAIGINLSLQYNYQIYTNFAWSAGFGYTRLSKALFKESYKNYAGEIIPVSTYSLTKPDLDNFVKTNLFTFKTGLTFNPGRFQFGANVILPLTNVSSTSLPIKTVNGQLFLRFTIK